MPGSIIVKVRRALIEGLTEALAEVDVGQALTVSYGWQGSDDTTTREQVFTNNARATHEPAALKSGRNFRNERMEFDVVVLVLGPGQKPDEVDDRALEIGAVIEEFVADHKGNELGVPGLNWINVTEVALNNMLASQGGSMSELTYTLTYDARLT